MAWYPTNTEKDGGIKIGSGMTGNIALSSATWTASGSGMYYATVFNVGKRIISVSLTSWAGLRTTDNIVPYIRGSNGTEISLMSNTNSFASSGSNVNVRYIYIDE